MREKISGLKPEDEVEKTAWQPVGSWVLVHLGEVTTMLWPARDVTGRLVVELGKRVLWT